MTCSIGKSIKTWIKKNNKFELNEFIASFNCHNDIINKVLYLNDGKIISCSNDKTIKIWDEIKENKHQCVTILTHLKGVNSFLLLNDKNLLISSSEEETKFWDLKNNNFKCIKIFYDIWTDYKNTLKRFDNEKIIIYNSFNENLTIISIETFEILFIIDNINECFSIEVFYNLGIFLIGKENDISIFNNNYNNIQIINDAHEDNINGFVQLKNGDILSFSNDENMKVWSFKITI